MQIGLVLTAGSARADVELAKRAEAAGFDAVFTIEFFNRHGYVPLGAIAEATRRVRLGTAIANAFTRTPLLHAAAALDLDDLSGGRAILGLGSATRRMNEDWYDVRFAAPAARMEELVRLLRAALEQRGMGFRWQGEHWTLEVPMYAHPAPRGPIPIWVAAVNRGMIATAGRAADGLVGHPVATRRWHREVTLPGLRAAEAQAGRPAGACALAPYVVTSLANTREEAVRNAKGQIGFYFTTEIYHSILDHHGLRAVGAACRAAFRQRDFAGLAAAVPDALVDEIAIACTPDEARDRLAEWKDLTDFALLYAPTVGVGPEAARENLERILASFGRG
ncbi:MAG: LLM class flavin-dependent oxidoreductase [Polyangiaceae bacterium]|nr:LLM class flavin-dependent oxidoreductase [Polyangiaceae bacterium]